MLGRKKIYSPPTFEDAVFEAEKGVYRCAFGCRPSNEALMEWDNCRQIDMSTVSETIELPPCDTDYVEAWRPVADEIYTPGDAGNGWIFTEDWVIGGSPCRVYQLDLVAHDHMDKTIFFDAEPEADSLTFVMISPKSGYERLTTIKRLTLVTNADVLLRNHEVAPNREIQEWGGRDDDQLVIVTSGSIELNGDGADLKGVAFRCGGYFYIRRGDTSGLGGDNFFRVAADKSILLSGGVGPDDLPPDRNAANDIIGKFGGTCDFTVGPPNPPAIVRWGVLTK